MLLNTDGLATFVRFWSEFDGSFDEPFRSYVADEFAQRQGATK